MNRDRKLSKTRWVWGSRCSVTGIRGILHNLYMTPATLKHSLNLIQMSCIKFDKPPMRELRKRRLRFETLNCNCSALECTTQSCSMRQKNILNSSQLAPTNVQVVKAGFSRRAVRDQFAPVILLQQLHPQSPLSHHHSYVFVLILWINSFTAQTQ